MKRLTKQQLRERGIFNSHNLASKAGNILYLDYTPATYGRMSDSASWAVVGIKFKTDPNGAWYNNGNKTFNVYCREEKQPQLEKAMAWIKETYGITEWERDAFGSYQIKGTLAKLLNISSNDGIK